MRTRRWSTIRCPSCAGSAGSADLGAGGGSCGGAVRAERIYQIRDELTVLLTEAAPDMRVDVDAVVRTLIARHGLVHPEYVPEREFWDLVRAHEIEPS